MPSGGTKGRTNDLWAQRGFTGMGSGVGEIHGKGEGGGRAAMGVLTPPSNSAGWLEILHPSNGRPAH